MRDRTDRQITRNRRPPARRGRDADFRATRRGTRVRVQHPVFSRLPSSLHTVPWLKLHARPLHEAHERPRTNLRADGVHAGPHARSATTVGGSRGSCTHTIMTTIEDAFRDGDSAAAAGAAAHDKPLRPSIA